jgi:hypothetical protein
MVQLNEHTWRYDGSRGSVWVQIYKGYGTITLNNNGQEWPNQGSVENLVWLSDKLLETTKHDQHTGGRQRLSRVYGEEAINLLYNGHVDSQNARSFAQQIVALL